MYQFQISTHVLYFFLILPFTKSEPSVLYERYEYLDGKICKDSDIAFRKNLIGSKSACLFECSIHSVCKSAFHAQNSGKCTGCTVIYDISNQMTELADGSKYYRQPDQQTEFEETSKYIEQPGCPDDWSLFENSCYFITEEKVNFQKGVEECESLNARAVIMDSKDENTFIKALITSKMRISDEDHFFYSGYTSIDNEGTWTAHGTTDELKFQDWANGEPNNLPSENCLAFFVQQDLRWVDITCDELANIVCEKEN